MNTVLLYRIDSLWFDVWAETLPDRKCDDVENFLGSEVRKIMRIAEDYEMTPGEHRRREMLMRDHVLLDNNICRFSSQEGGCERENCPMLHVGHRRRN